MYHSMSYVFHSYILCCIYSSFTGKLNKFRYYSLWHCDISDITLIQKCGNRCVSLCAQENANILYSIHIAFISHLQGKKNNKVIRLTLNKNCWNCIFSCGTSFKMLHISLFNFYRSCARMHKINHVYFSLLMEMDEV